MRIFVFGNEHVQEDSKALQIAKELSIEGVEFQSITDINEIIRLEERIADFVMMDVVKGIKEVKLITDLKKLTANKLLSLHDFDLGYFLKLKYNLGQISHIKIIGIPMKGRKDRIKKKVSEIINSIKKEADQK